MSEFSLFSKFHAKIINNSVNISVLTKDRENTIYI